jgi:hypothetical protein
MKETVFEVGDKVYCVMYGWGEITRLINSHVGEYPIEVTFHDDKAGTKWYTPDGRYILELQPTLSFTEYTLNGFSQERPIELPEVGEEIMVSNDRDNWVIREFVRYNPNNAHHVVVCEGDCTFRYFKRFR